MHTWPLDATLISIMSFLNFTCVIEWVFCFLMKIRILILAFPLKCYLFVNVSWPAGLPLTLICWWWLILPVQTVAKTWENDSKPGTWVLIWEYSARAIKWIPTWQGLDGFQKTLRPCPLGESSPSTVRVTGKCCFFSSDYMISHLCIQQSSIKLINVLINLINERRIL